jgi:glycosyltransferase involved in cell wall biosynthesis
MIPRIIHQLWDNKKRPIPVFFRNLAETWKANHPDWVYEFWDQERMNRLVNEHFSDLAEMYFNYPYDAQRWNVIRYLILYKMGGLYVDFDYECIETFDSYLEGKTCFFSLEPEDHLKKANISNALMGAIPEHPFIKEIIENLRKFNIRFEEDKVTHVITTTGRVYLTQLYQQYANKENIYLFPAERTMPLSQKEIQSYIKGEVSDDALELKLEKAIAVHYFSGTWYSSLFIDKIPCKTKVLYLSTSDGNGGAANAAYRIHCGLLDIGIESKMLVQSSVRHQPNIYISSQKQKNDRLPLKDYKLQTMIFSPAIAGTNINKYIRLFKPEIVQLHWINNGFVKIEDLQKIKQKIVWRFPDCWPVTGGCHYFGTCDRYMYSCGKCPQLSSDNEDDLSYQVWRRKQESWKNLNMTVVVPSVWMKNVVEKSSLFRNRRIEIIPNGLNIKTFSPLDKMSARKVLNLPLNKQIILFGAYNALMDRRKGFIYLKMALKKLAIDWRNKCELVIFGAEPQEIDIGFPVHFVGTLKDNLSLQIVYSSTDVMVVPSTEEAFGQTVSEALACAVPVVVFDNTGPASIVDHKQNGYIATKEDADSLAQGIDWVLKKQGSGTFLSENARLKAVDYYDYRKVAEMYQRLYESL